MKEVRAPPSGSPTSTQRSRKWLKAGGWLNAFLAFGRNRPAGPCSRCPTRRNRRPCPESQRDSLPRSWSSETSDPDSSEAEAKECMPDLGGLVHATSRTHRLRLPRLHCLERVNQSADQELSRARG